MDKGAPMRPKAGQTTTRPTSRHSTDRMSELSAPSKAFQRICPLLVTVEITDRPWRLHKAPAYVELA